MSTFAEDMARLNKACRDIRDVILAELQSTPIGRFFVWALRKRDDALESDLPPRAVVVVVVVLFVAFVVFGWWLLRGWS